VLHPAPASSASAAVAVEGCEIGWALGPVLRKREEKREKEVEFFLFFPVDFPTSVE
jgi:hypothetical protein